MMQIIMIHNKMNVIREAHTVHLPVSPGVCLLPSVVTVALGIWEALVSSGCH